MIWPYKMYVLRQGAPSAPRNHHCHEKADFYRKNAKLLSWQGYLLQISVSRNLNILINDGYSSALVSELAQKVRISEYKRRQAAPGIRVSQKAFGVGRRYPIVNKYNA